MHGVANGRILVGVGGWTYADWRGSFFPKGLPHAQELAHAAARLSSIEVNGTFYRTQTPKTFARWRDETPPGFILALKAPRYATNRRTLADAGESIERFIGSGIAELGDRLGPINWQFPPTRRFDADDFASFLKLLPPKVQNCPLRHAVEVRHPSFDCDAFVDLARRHGVAIVLAGDSEYPRIEADTADFAYARIMGTTSAEKLGYARADLKRWATEAQRVAKSGRDMYLYVISGHKALNPAAAEALLQQLRPAKA